VLKQQIFFCYNGKVIKEVDYPVNKIRLKITNGKSIEIQENVLVNIGIAEGTNGSLYVLKGNGGCNSCTEFIGCFHLKVNYYGIVMLLQEMYLARLVILKKY